MKVIVTGAAGFLGSHLAKHHLNAGDEVVGFDDFSSSVHDSKHLADLKSNPKFKLIVQDISDPLAALYMSNVDAKLIYNFACPASPPRYQDMPVHTMMTCVAGTRNALIAAERSGATVVHASTSEVYGDPECSPQKETYRGCVNSYGPRSCYDEGKRAAEALCYDYFNSMKVDARLVRIFNTYGPHMDPYDGRVVTNFIRQALKLEKITIYGEGNQTRSFCYVDDLVRGIVALGALPENPRMPINIGNPNEFTIRQLAEEIAYKMGATQDAVVGNWLFEHKPLPTDDPMQRRPDITLAKELLGWEPKVQLREGLDRTIKYLKTVVK